MSRGSPRGRNIASVSWPDHLSFGEGDGRLDSLPAVQRRMESWQTELGAGAIHWRLLRTHLPGHFSAAPGYTHATEAAARTINWDDLEQIPRLAHTAGLRAYLYAALFDEGWPLAPEAERLRSYHNEMHAQHVAWQSEFVRRHPEYQTVDRHGGRQQGVVCLAYPEVRRHFVERFVGLATRGDFDGFFLCLRSQSRPAEHADQFGFNEPVARDFERRTGRPLAAAGLADGAALTPADSGPAETDLRAAAETDPGRGSLLQVWRDLLGSYLTKFIRELHGELQSHGLELAVGCARGDVLGPPLGNATLDWRAWIAERLVTQLVINQDSSRCPSMWHRLWPMHRGRGYLQCTTDGSGLPSLERQLVEQYAPALGDAPARLYVARQWDERSPDQERRLLAQPVVAGLVFSSFRHDNPAAVARGDWRA